MAKIVTMGEIMLRLSPAGNSRFVQTDSFSIIPGGGEANVAVSLANSVFSAVFSQWFVDYYPEFEILIETESGYSVSFTQSGIDPLSESSPVFVKADTNLYLSGTAVKTNGAEVSFPKTEIAVTKPCTWQTVSIDASQASNGSIEIILEDTVKEIKEISVELNPDAPGQDAMSAGEKN